MPQYPRNNTDLRWLSLRDFTAGCYSQSRLVASNPSPGSREATSDSGTRADPYNTFSCIGLPNGGLGPLPAVTNNFGTGPTFLHTPDYPSLISVTGIKVGAGLDLGAPPDRIFIGYEYDKSTPNRWFEAKRIDVSTSVYHNIASFSAPGSPGLGLAFGTSIEVMLMQASGAGIPLHPVAIFAWAPVEHPTNPKGQVIGWPGDPTVDGVFTLIVGNALAGVHQGRVVGLLFAELLQWDASFYVNEAIVFTDPPMEENAFNPATVPFSYYAPENPSGYGCIDSVNAGELLLIKHRDGGVLVSGDLNSPTITDLPSLTSTGGICSKGANSAIGFVYFVRSNGVWVWAGGDTSQKISDQLEDNSFDTRLSDNYGFYTEESSIVSGSPYRFGYSAQAEEWQDWIILSGGWIYDTNTKSWWRLQPQGSTNPHSLQWFDCSSWSDFMWAAEGRVRDAGGGVFFSPLWLLDRRNLATFYQWQGYAFSETIDRTIEARMCRVKVIANEAASVQVSVIGSLSGATVSESVTFNFLNPSPYPQVQELPLHLTADSLAVKIVAADNAVFFPAPTVMSVDIGYVDGTTVVSGAM